MPTLPTVPFLLTVALASTLSLTTACDDDDLTGIEEAAEFEAGLTGAAERPDPVTTTATGTALFDVDGTTVRFRVEVEDIEDVTLAHIHVGGTEVAGPIVVELFNAGATPNRSRPEGCWQRPRSPRSTSRRPAGSPPWTR